VYFALTSFCFSEVVTGALGSREELANISIGQIGLELPPSFLIVGATPRPNAPGLEHGMGLCLHLLSPLYFLVFVRANAWFFGFSGL
jgi:hypothetical protein